MQRKSVMTQQEFSGNGKGNGKTAELQLIEYIYNTDPDKLAGLTRLPLDQVNPCSFAKIYANELKELAKLAKKSQEMYSKNYEKWHSNETVVDGRFVRVPPDPDYVEVKAVPYWKRLLWGKKHFIPEKKRRKPTERKIDIDAMPVINVKTDPRFDIPSEKTIVERWLEQYYMHRRSTTPDLLMGAIELASRQIESKAPEPEDEWNKVMRQ